MNLRFIAQGARHIASAAPRMQATHPMCLATRPGRPCLCVIICLAAFGLFAISIQAAVAPTEGTRAFPPSLESYGDAQMTGLWAVLEHRVRQQPLNLLVTVLFLAAIVHTFLAGKFLHWAHLLEERHANHAKTAGGPGPGPAPGAGASAPHGLKMAARVLHFLGEVEVVFGIWCVPLFVLLAGVTGWDSTVNYFSHDVRFVEPVFVVVIMAVASTKPVLQLAERCVRWLARLGGGGPAAWWLAILTVGPVLGSFITEPAAMTISALLLAKQFYARNPSPRLAYATLGLLFVNISVGGVLTHFAAPPVLMVAAPWGWTTPLMFVRFGWAALTGMAIANALYYAALRKEFRRLALWAGESVEDSEQAPVPLWVTGVHLGFLGWMVLNAHHPALLLGGFLFFLAFCEVTREHQSAVRLRSPLLVGCFLAGLVIHGGLQQWWIGPILARLTEVPLMLGATALTAFNDNAAITYLATLVPGLSGSLKYAVVAGALTGGGLTVIANAPNPAGQAILGRFFEGGIKPLGLLLGALPATVILMVCFLCAR
jgi:hypothetical protein